MTIRGPYKSKRLEKIKACNDGEFISYIKERIDHGTTKKEIIDATNARLDQLLLTIVELQLAVEFMKGTTEVARFKGQFPEGVIGYYKGKEIRGDSKCS